jgi:hypothetical protein
MQLGLIYGRELTALDSLRTISVEGIILGVLLWKMHLNPEASGLLPEGKPII